MKSLKLRKGISENDALDYYSLLQDMLNGYMSMGRVTKSNFISDFLNHEKNLEKIPDLIFYGIAEQEEK